MDRVEVIGVQGLPIVKAGDNVARALGSENKEIPVRRFHRKK